MNGGALIISEWRVAPSPVSPRRQVGAGGRAPRQRRAGFDPPNHAAAHRASRHRGVLQEQPGQGAAGQGHAAPPAGGVRGRDEELQRGGQRVDRQLRAATARWRARQPHAGCGAANPGNGRGRSESAGRRAHGSAGRAAVAPGEARGAHRQGLGRGRGFLGQQRCRAPQARAETGSTRPTRAGARARARAHVGALRLQRRGPAVRVVRGEPCARAGSRSRARRPQKRRPRRRACSWRCRAWASWPSVWRC